MLSGSLENKDAENQKQIVENEEKIISCILEKFGLNWAAISAGGQSAADLMSNTLSYIAVVKSGPNNIIFQIERTAVCSALLTWQSMSSRHLKEKALYSNSADSTPCYIRILSIIQNILSLPNDPDPLPFYKYGAQMSGLYLSQLLLCESKESVSAANQLSEPIAKSLDLIFTKKGSSGESITIREEPTSIGAAPITIGPDSVRAETVKNLVKCIYLQLSDASAAVVTECLLRVMARCLDTAPSLCADISSTVSSLLANRYQQPGRLKAHMSTLVGAIKNGHTQLLPLLKNNPTLFSSEIRGIETHVESLLVSVGVLDLSELLVDISNNDARKLIKSIPTLIIELEQSNEQQKKLVLGVLLAISLCDPAAVAAHLVPIEAACYPPSIVIPSVDYVPNVSPPRIPLSSCRLPLLKLLAATGAKSHSEEIVTQCLAAVARMIRAIAASLADTGTDITKEEQGACLEAVNIIKDRARYCNIFHKDTLRAMDKIADSDDATHRNLCRWNGGKTALKGDLNLFLLTAGQAHLTQSAPEEAQHRDKKWWLPFGSSKAKAKIGVAPSQSARPATAPVGTPSAINSVYGSKSGRAVGPSPFFNHGEAMVLSADTPAVAKNLFGDKAPSLNHSQSDGPGQFVSFSEFINRQKNLTEVFTPRQEASGLGPTPLPKSDGLSEASPVGETKDGERA